MPHFKHLYGCIRYADDVILLCLTVGGLKYLPSICEYFFHRNMILCSMHLKANNKSLGITVQCTNITRLTLAGATEGHENQNSFFNLCILKQY